MIPEGFTKVDSICFYKKIKDAPVFFQCLSYEKGLPVEYGEMRGTHNIKIIAIELPLQEKIKFFFETEIERHPVELPLGAYFVLIDPAKTNNIILLSKYEPA